ncbi:MAG: hypothetical protein R2714_09870 [Microthrixaceae bacterium]|nr:hypothetical protein [Microthrixaceae bacterium]
MSPQNRCSRALVSLGLFVTLWLVVASPAAGAATGADSDAGPAVGAEPAPGVGAVDQAPMVTVAARRDLSGPTVPLLVAATLAMLGLGFGMLGIRCVRGPVTDR